MKGKSYWLLADEWAMYNGTSHCQVVLKTESVFSGNAISSFLGYYEVAQETRSTFVPSK